MNSERWRQVEAICHTALEREPSERAPFVATACAGDDDLRREVESLLAEQQSAEQLFAATAWDAAAESLAEQEAGETARATGGEPAARTLGHFRLIDKIGAGGMGVVYRARDEQLGRDVAVKLLPGGTFQDGSARARLLREARAAAALNHPHICSVYEVGESDSGAFIAMELIEGETLSEMVARGPLAGSDVTRYGVQLADALVHAHARDIVHRDLKSANIVVNGDGRAKILDFGLARHASGGAFGDTGVTRSSLSAAGIVTGTLAYMAPEQLRGAPPDARSDIWALGVVLHECLTGRRPFDAETGPALGAAILNEAPARLPSLVPLELRAVIERCLEKDPERRYRSAVDLRDALEAIQTGTTSRWAVWRYAIARRPQLIMGATLLAIAIAAGFSARHWLAAHLGLASHSASLAVLPLENLSHDPERAYLADALHETLITELSGTEGMTVIQRASVKRFEDTRKSLAEVARELGVDWLVTGTVMQSDARVQVTVHLVKASTETAQWSAKYDRQVTDVLRLQGEVVSAIASELKGRIAPERRARLARAINPDTYQLIARARFLANKGTPEGFEKAVAYLTQATRDDPNEPLAHASLAMVYSLMAHEGVLDAQVKAGGPARRALELDPLSAETHQALGETKAYYEWDLEGAAGEYRQATRLNPNLPDAHAHYSWYLNTLDGRTGEQFAEMKKAQALDPLNPLYPTWLGQMYLLVQQNDEALAQADRALELDPASVNATIVRIQAYSGKKMHRQALVLAQKLAAKEPATRVVLAQALVDAGRIAEARRLADELDRTMPANAFEAFWLATLFGTSGDRDRALRWVERMIETRHVWVPWIDPQFRADPRLDSLRADGRYKALLAKIKRPRA